MRPLPILMTVALLAASCGDSSVAPLESMQVQRTSEDGAVEVRRGTETIEVEGGFDIEPGDVVATSGGGTAQLRLGGDRRIELAPGSSLEVLDDDSVESISGSLLVSTGPPTDVSFSGARAAASDGDFRVDTRMTTTRVGSYGAKVIVSAPGEPRATLTSLFQASVAAGDVSRAMPYQFADDDEWDRKRLADVISLDEDLRRLAAGFENQLGRSRPDLDLYRDVTGRRDIRFMKPYLRRPPSDLVIGYVVANSSGDPLKEAFASVLSLRAADGAWGVIAAIEEVDSGPLVAQVEGLFLEQGGLASDGDTIAVASGPSGGDNSGEGPTDDGGPGPGDDDPGDDPGPKPRPSPSPTPTECDGNLVTCVVEETLEEVPPLLELTD